MVCDLCDYEGKEGGWTFLNYTIKKGPKQAKDKIALCPSCGVRPTLASDSEARGGVYFMSLWV